MQWRDTEAITCAGNVGSILLLIVVLYECKYHIFIGVYLVNKSVYYDSFTGTKSSVGIVEM